VHYKESSCAVIIPLKRGRIIFLSFEKLRVILATIPELHKLYSPPNIIRMISSRRMRWAWHVAQMGEKRKAYRTFVRKPERKRPLRRPRRRWVSNIKIDIRIGWDGLD
jgi:hypothetical protein